MLGYPISYEGRVSSLKMSLRPHFQRREAIPLYNVARAFQPERMTGWKACPTLHREIASS
jgi:hypothetical protein